MKPMAFDAKRRQGFFRPRLMAMSVAACFAVAPAWGLPTGAQVVAGSASFARTGNVLNITNTPGAILNWGAFSIGASEAVRFQQQNSLSSVLNRVTGKTASSILGELTSNGRVWLVNPNGILFGAGSRVDVNGLIASTLNISNEDFLAGRLNFVAGNAPGALKNAGQLSATHNIYLVGPDIENSGILRSERGEVLLAAGRQVTLVDAAHPDIQVVVSAPGDKAVNLGEIAAGKISVFGSLIQQKGRMNADRVEVDDHGRIVFRATQQIDVEAGSRTTTNGPEGGGITVQTTAGDTYVRGTVEAIGKVGAGGTATILGNRVAVMDQAVIDASGEKGGGTILVGGDYQGKNPAIQNANVTYFGPEATLKANAGKVGDGGTAIVWADDTTRAYGTIEARGGSQKGNGGFVETSGHMLSTTGIRVDTSAPYGMRGTWLIDPWNLVISDSPTSAVNITDDGYGGPPFSFDASASGATVYAGDIMQSLASGNVTVTTGDPQVVGEAGNLTVNAAINWNAPSQLTLSAYGGVFVNQPISSSFNPISIPESPPSSLVINTGAGGIALNAPLSLPFGNITLGSSGSVSQTAAISASQLQLNGSGVSGNVYTLQNAGNSVGTLAVNVTCCNGGGVSFSNAGPLSVGNVSTGGGAITLSSTGKLTINGNLNSAGDGSDGVITLSASSGGLELAATKTINAPKGLGVTGSFTNNGGIQIGNGSTPYTMQVSGGFTQTVTGSLGLYVVTGDKLSATGDITLNGTFNTLGSTTPGTYSDVIKSTSGTVSNFLSTVTPAGATFASNGVNALNLSLVTLSNITWDGGGNDNLWFTQNNWSTNTVPTASNNVNLMGASVVLSNGSGNAYDFTTGTGSLTINNGSLTLGGNGSFNALDLQAGSSIIGNSSKTFTVGDSFIQNATASITGFNYVHIQNTSGALILGNISTAGFNSYTSGTSGVIELSGPTISQHPGTTLSGSAIKVWHATTGDVTLDQANPTGVISANFQGVAGNLVFNSINPIHVAMINDEGNGINLVNGYVKLTSSSSGTAFTQSAPIIAPGGLTLVGTGANQGVSLMNTSNNFSTFSMSLTSANMVEIMQGGVAGMGTGTVGGVTGLNLPGATKLKIVNANVAGSLNIGSAVSVGSAASVELSSGSGGIMTTTSLSAKDFRFAADGPISLGASVTASEYVQMSNRDATTFSVAGTCTGGPCIGANDFADIAAPLGVTFGDRLTHPTSTLSATTAIDASSFGGATKPASINLVSASNGSISLTGGSFGTAATPLATLTPSLYFNATGDAYITNNASAPGPVSAYGGASGLISFINYGATTISNNTTAGGNISLTANSPLTIASGATVSSSTGSVSLTAGSGGALTVDGSVSATSGTVSASAGSVTGGGTITDTANPSGTTTSSFVLTSAFTNNTPGAATPPPPTLDACVANPSLTGCSTVLPTLDTCTTAPTTPGCSVVLPTVDACVASPTLPGCTTVLPTLATCTVTPTAAGCSAVLPTFDTCTTAPTTPGCSVVLPTVDACVASPTLPGCTTVLPTLATCTVTPTAAGCSVVLPTFDTCTTAPTTLGCSVILPTMDACVTNPAAAGCSAVLPTLATCTAAPATTGCSAVLPPTTLPTDQQLACLIDPTVCTPGTTPPTNGTVQEIIQQVDNSQQQVVLNTQIGQSSTGRPDLYVIEPSAGGGGTGDTSGDGRRDGQANDGEGQSGQSGTQQGVSNVPNQRRYCN